MRSPLYSFGTEPGLSRRPPALFLLMHSAGLSLRSLALGPLELRAHTPGLLKFRSFKLRSRIPRSRRLLRPSGIPLQRPSHQPQQSDIGPRGLSNQEGRARCLQPIKCLSQ